MLREEVMSIDLEAFIEDYEAGVGDPVFKADVEQAWDNVTSAWGIADEDQQGQIRQFWEIYQPPKPASKSDVMQLKKVTKIILNYVALSAPEFLIDVDGLPIRV
jgi:hypothetical protein